jgi:hypothetical protein
LPQGVLCPSSPAAGVIKALTGFQKDAILDLMAAIKTTKFLTTARSKALSRVFLNVSQLLLVGMFLSEAFGRLALEWRVLALVVIGISFVAGIWFATDDKKEEG